MRPPYLLVLLSSVTDRTVPAIKQKIRPSEWVEHDSAAVKYCLGNQLGPGELQRTRESRLLWRLILQEYMLTGAIAVQHTTNLNMGQFLLLKKNIEYIQPT